MSGHNSDAAVAFYLRGTRQSEQMDICREYGMLRFGLDDGFRLFQDSETMGAENHLPGLARLRKEAREGTMRAVICAEMDALCRTTGELLEIARYFDKCGVALVFARERLDLSSATGRSLIYSAGMLQQLERRAAAANIRDNMRALARTGRWLGGVTPTGYISRRAPHEPGQPRVFRLELHPEQAETVRKIYSMFLEHDSLSKVTQALAGQNITTKNGRAFSRFTVRQILENPVYMRADADAFTYFSQLGAEVCSAQESFDGTRGMMVYNKTAQQQGQPVQQRNVSEWIVAVGEHKGLIDGASWIAVQQQLGRNKSKTERKPKSDYGLLAEMLYCADCGAHMRPKLTQRDDGSGEAAFSYLCERKEQSRSGECDMPNLSGHAADAAVAGMLANLDPEEPDLLPIHPEQPATPEAMAEHLARMEETRELITQNEKGISSLVFSLIKAIDKSAYDEIIKQIDLLHRQNSELCSRLSVMEAISSPHHPMGGFYLDSLRELLESWRGNYTAMSMARRRASLRALILSITWDGKELLARFAGGAEFAITPFYGNRSGLNAAGRQ